MNIYNHCIEDRQKNLALMAMTPTLCRVITIKPLSHLAYVLPEGKVAPAHFNEANKVLYSKMSYEINEKNMTQVTGLIDFVKQISAVRRVTDEEFEVSRNNFFIFYLVSD